MEVAANQGVSSTIKALGETGNFRDSATQAMARHGRHQLQDVGASDYGDARQNALNCREILFKGAFFAGLKIYATVREALEHQSCILGTAMLSDQHSHPANTLIVEIATIAVFAES